jgi:hypothetical protein
MHRDMRTAYKLSSADMKEEACWVYRRRWEGENEVNLEGSKI